MIYFVLVRNNGVLSDTAVNMCHGFEYHLSSSFQEVFRSILMPCSDLQRSNCLHATIVSQRNKSVSKCLHSKLLKPCHSRYTLRQEITFA